MNQTVTAGQFELLAHNYGELHANKIHSDEGAARYGFKGALVPGVALYAYCSQAAVRTFGEDWHQRGRLSAKFIQPIYDRERVIVQARPGETPGELQIQLVKADGQISTYAVASLAANTPACNSITLATSIPPIATTDSTPVSIPAVSGFEAKTPPADSARRAPRIAALTVGETLGTHMFKSPQGEEAKRFLADMCDELPCYRGGAGFVHPAFLVAQANKVFMTNIRLGPWVHTASDVQHFSAPHAGQTLSLRSRVLALTEKRGNEIITADMVLLDERAIVLATIRHSAIIHLAEKAAA